MPVVERRHQTEKEVCMHRGKNGGLILNLTAMGGIACALLGVCAGAAAQPVNDNCAGAAPLTGSVTLVVDTSTATTNPNEGQGNSACSNPINGTTGIEKDVWFVWTADDP